MQYTSFSMKKRRTQKIINSIYSICFLVNAIICLALSRRWLFWTELIFPAMVLQWIVISCIFFIGNFRGAVKTEVRQIKQLWLVIIWGLNLSFLRTDYLTSLWRPVLMIILFFICGVSTYGKVTTPQIYRVLIFMTTIINIEVPHYRSMSENASLFLKSEVAKRQE